jgi:F-type H+-transporting ATPase subunit alpha
VKKLGGGVRLALAQYRELAAFAQFASDLDDTTRKQLERGRLVTELMKQAQYKPQQVWQIALTLFGVNVGFFDGVSIDKVLEVERDLHSYMHTTHADLVNRIENTKDLSKEDEAKLGDLLKEYRQTLVL